MKLTIRLAALAAVLGACPIAGADPEVRWLGLKLARGIADTKDLGKPAELSYTRPSEGDSTAVVNAGIYGIVGVRLPPFMSEFDGGISLHRNTAIAKKQNVVLSGLGARGEFVEWLQHHFSFQHKNNRLSGARGGVASLDLIPYVPAMLNSRAKISDHISVVPTLAFGTEYERVSSSDEKTATELRGQGLEPTGSVLRLTAGAGFEFEFYERVTFGGTVGYWRDQKQTGPFARDEKSKSYRTLSLALPLDKAQNFAISIDYVRGNNPIEGVSDANYTQITFKLKPSFL